MKIKDVLNENRNYLDQLIKNLEKRLTTYQIEVDKIKADLKEAKKQFQLLKKVNDFVDTVP